MPLILPTLQLPKRWAPLRPHAEQNRLWTSSSRFCVVPSGRRSGKTELAKRKIVLRALQFAAYPDGWFVCAAPTRDQAKRIYWRDLKLLVPRELRVGRPNESDLNIRLVNGADITVVGMDSPERVEGRPLDGIVIDEYGNMKPEVWGEHVRPSLSTDGRPGWAWLIGVPEGRNHYWKIAQHAQSHPEDGWGYYHWKSADILPAEEIRAAMADLDRRTYLQEYEGSFVDFEGRAYYDFDRATHAVHRLGYNPGNDLIFCFDFNVSPGVAVICQEQRFAQESSGLLGDAFTAVIGEVWIPKNSNTPAVCRKLIADWKHHKGKVYCYGDATGGAKKSSATEGTDWDLVKNTLGKVFGDRLCLRHGHKNPPERVRVNAMNSRIKNASGDVRLLVDPINAPHVVIDLEGVVTKEGTAGELDKDVDPDLTHISDALGYYVYEKYPLHAEGRVSVSTITY